MNVIMIMDGGFISFVLFSFGFLGVETLFDGVNC